VQHLAESTQLHGRIGTRAKLYLAICQNRLGHPDLAKDAVENINEMDFDSTDAARFAELMSYLYVPPPPEAPGKLRAWASPYYGHVSYSSGFSKLSGNVYGLYAGAGYKSWDFTFGIEKLGLDLTIPLPSYSQTQDYFALSHFFTQNFGMRGNLTLIGSAQTNYDSIKIYGFGLSYWPSYYTHFDFDYDHSDYPAIVAGGAQANELTFSWNQLFLASGRFSLGAKATSESVFVNSATTTDPLTHFAFRSSYQRFALDLSMTAGIFGFTLGGWLGKEALGVREQGAFVLDALEEHRSGWSSSVKVELGANSSLKFSVSQEKFIVNGPELNSTSYVGGISLYL
jgi:hypothetical protein